MNPPQKWKKQKLLFEPRQNRPWLASHAALPIADLEQSGLCRIYFTGRDERNRSQIGFLKVNLSDPAAVLELSEFPVLRIGAMGAFDDSGVSTSWIVNHKNRKYLYYTGWTKGVTVPFYLFIGLAVSEDGGGTFQRISPAPILDRDQADSYLTASPCVLLEDGLWRMWYVSGTGWVLEQNKPKHFYHIKYAESNDGISWKRSGLVCIDYASPDEHAIARPAVIKEDGLYKMWFSFRGLRYRMGYAVSRDGIHWERKDSDVGIEVSASGWDSDMMEYPFVFKYRGKKFMLYNGNGYGLTGIGYATMD